MILLESRGLCGGYGGSAALREVDLVVGEGTCTVILGPNGAGKSTLLRLLAGILAPTRGEVTLLGRPLPSWRRREVARHVGYLPQFVDFSFPLTVEEVVEQGRAPHLGPWRPPDAHDRAAIRRALERMELVPFARRPVRTLSGGERQRVLLARALATEPLLLLLDEPAAALDVRHQMELVAVVQELRRGGTGVVLVLHDWNLGLRLADQVLLLKEGAVVAAGPPEALLCPKLFRSVFGVSVRLLGSDTAPPYLVPVGVA